MGLGDKFFGLFSKPKKQPDKEQEEKTEQATSAVQNVQEDKQEPKVEVTKLPPVLQDDFMLPNKHTAYRLLDLWSVQIKRPVQAQLSLSPAEQPVPMTQDEIKMEHSLFLTRLTNYSTQRIDMMRVDAEGKPTQVMDADVLFYFARNSMAVWAMIFPPIGAGKEMTKERFYELAAKANVKYGILSEYIEQKFESGFAYFALFPVAIGKPSVRGEDGYVIDYFPRKRSSEYRVDEQGKVDYSSINVVHNVSEGTVICDIVPPKPGEEGMNVHGEKITISESKPATVPKGRNTELNEEGTQLIATRAGHVEFSGKSFQVKPVLILEEGVNYNTGDINFLGDVTVKGDVATGFTIHALGNVYVDGVVEGCTIEAGGDVTIVRGVTGQGSAVIRAQKDVVACFLEHSIVYARGMIKADCAIECQLFSDDKVEITTGRGAIVGGTVKAAREVEATVTGSKSERQTNIVLGGFPCESFERTQIENDVQTLEQNIEQTAKMPNSPAKQTQLSDYRLKLCVAKMKLEKFDQSFLEMAGETPNLPNRRFHSGTAYHGTKVTIDEQVLAVEEETRNCTIYLNGEGEISLSTS